MRSHLLGLLCILALIAACSGSKTEEIGVQITALCEQTRDLHNAIAEAANTMAAAEVDATPARRAELAAGALEAMIAVARNTGLPTEPAELTAGLADRRDAAVIDLERELGVFRSEWSEIQQDERPAAITRVFVLGERLMSETEPRITALTSDGVIESIRSESSCRNVIQLPPR